MRHVVFLILLLALFVQNSFAATPYQAGFKTIGGWKQESGLRMEISVWYPSRRQSSNLTYGHWVIRGAANASPAEGQFPILLLSHASPATRFSYHTLASRLAQHGYIVAAPTHLKDSIHNMDDMYTIRQLSRRCEEMDATLQIVREDAALAPVVKPDSVGFIGFGTGGATGLILGGARPDCTFWPEYCKNAAPLDPYCYRMASEKITSMCSQLEELPVSDMNLKAVACIAPEYGMLFSADSFKNFHPSVLLVGEGRNIYGRPGSHSEAIARQLGKRALYLDLPQADDGAFMAECPLQLAEELPELCESVTPEVRQKLRATLEQSLLSFFDRILLTSPD